MNLQDVFGSFQVVPILSYNEPQHAADVAGALREGGLPLVEVTFRSPQAPQVLKALARERDVLAGAGTVRRVDQVRMAAEAGARFLVSPCFSEAVAQAAAEAGLPYLPGVATATEIQRATEHGVTLLKFFPAEAAGGLAALRALAEPFNDVQFVPTGGIRGDNAASYLEHPRVVAVGGSWMLPARGLAERDWAGLAECVRAAARLPVPGSAVAQD